MSMVLASRQYPRNFVAHLRQLASEQPDDVALIALRERDGQMVGDPLSYSSFEQRVRALAARLQDGFGIGDRALLLLDNDEHYATAFFACMYAGLVAVPVFPPESMRPQHLARLTGIAQDARARCILSTSSLRSAMAPLFDALPDAVGVDVDLVEPSTAQRWRDHEPAEGHIAFLQYTSGSTAAPKGVMVSHGNLMANERAMEEMLGLRESDVFASWLPLYHDMGLIGGLLQPIHRGAPVLLMTPRFFLERPLRWLEAITRYRVTVTGGPDFAFRLCVDRIKDSQLVALDLSSWRIAYTGAEPVRHDTLLSFEQRFQQVGFDASAFQPCYGLAEATLFITGGRARGPVVACDFDSEGLAQGRASRTGSGQGTTLVGCGRVASGHHLCIANPLTSESLPEGAIGEIQASGPSIAGGYWANEAASREVLPERDGKTWLRTGDLGFLLDHQLYVTGRIKDLIIVRGHNIYPQDIERAIEREVEAVRAGRVSAFAVTERGREGIGIAAEVSRSMQKLLRPQALVEALSTVVSELCGEPLSVVALLQPGALPKTSSGKLQRQAARLGVRDESLDAYAIWKEGRFTLGGEESVERVTEESEQGVARELADLWREVLGLEKQVPISGQSNFFLLGGNSLAATEVVARIGERWGVSPAVRSLFDRPVLNSFAAVVSSLLAGGAEFRAEVPLIPLESVDRRGPMPLSAAQQRQWFLWRLDPLGTAYHVSLALHLAGRMDVQRLREAFAGLLQRHESLRTVFEAGNDNQGRQRVLASVDAELEIIDLSAGGEPSADRMHEAIRTLDTQPFDLTLAPPLRAALIRQAPELNTLVVVMHHIVSDGASMQILINELAERYRALAAGEDARLAPLPVHYVDYAAWQRRWLSEPGGEGAPADRSPGEDIRARQLAYWIGQLGDETDAVVLPTDHPRQDRASHRAMHRQLELPAPLAAAVRDAAVRQGVTVFMLLLSGLQVLLHRYSGQPEVRVGVPIANRHRPGTANVVGFFVNTQVMCARFCGRTTLAEAVHQTREAALSAQEHQDLPFEQIVSVLRPERVVGTTPLFQVSFNFLQEDLRPFESATGLRVSRWPVEAAMAQFDLSVEVRDLCDGALHLRLSWARELFEEATMTDLGEHYLQVLAAMASHPDLAIGDIALRSSSGSSIPRDEREPGDWLPGDDTLHGLFERQVLAQAGAVAVSHGVDSLSYAELNERADRLAHWLLDQGVGREARVGVALERSARVPLALLAILKAGGTYVPLDPAYPAERLSFIARDAGIVLLLTEQSVLAGADLGERLGTRAVDMDQLDLGTQPATSPGVLVHPDQLAYVIYTSGSTGQPKGAQLSHRNVTRLLSAAQPLFRFGRDDVWTWFHSYAFDFSVWEIFGALCTGGRLVVVPYLTSRSPEDLLVLLKKHRVTVLNQTPSAFRQLVHATIRHGADALALREVIFGGEALEPHSLRPWFDAVIGDRPRLVNMFGITETAVHVTFRPVTRKDVDRQSCSPIGRALSDLTVHVLDGDLNPMPVGMPGELYVSGAGLARGYLRRAGLSADRFVANPFSDHGERLYRTGDRGRWRRNGELEYLGRGDQQVKIRGFRIEPGEIDAQLLALPQVRDAATLALDGTQLVSYVVLVEGAERDVAAIRRALAAVLPDYMLPSVITCLDALPLTANGKLDRRALPAPDAAQGQAYEAPDGDAAQALAAIWAEVLGVERVGARDNFFDLGGHSLQVLRVHQLIEERLGPVVSVVELFKYPTIAALAERVLRGSAEDRRATAGSNDSQEEQRIQRQRVAMQSRRQAAANREESV